MACVLTADQYCVKKMLDCPNWKLLWGHLFAPVGIIIGGSMSKVYDEEIIHQILSEKFDYEVIEDNEDNIVVKIKYTKYYGENFETFVSVREL